MTVVADAYNSCAFHLTDFRQLFAFGTVRDGSDGEDIGVTCGSGFFQNEARHRRIIIDRFRIRHTTNARESACDGSVCAGLNRLFVLKSRLAEMDMKINKSGCYDEVGSIEYFCAFGGQPFANGFNFAITNEQVEVGFECLRRVENSSVLNE